MSDYYPIRVRGQVSKNSISNDTLGPWPPRTTSTGRSRTWLATWRSSTATPAPLPSAAKIALFRGREGFFPKRWDNPKTGKAGYSPACRNEWVRGVCGKPKVEGSRPQPSGEPAYSLSVPSETPVSPRGPCPRRPRSIPPSPDELVEQGVTALSARCSRMRRISGILAAAYGQRLAGWSQTICPSLCHCHACKRQSRPLSQAIRSGKLVPKRRLRP